uniref:Uncharacterized protein n=1 Tax=Rhinolophus ferrumequinum TaxID=59479 RepID=A0A671EJS9_RHIFE
NILVHIFCCLCYFDVFMFVHVLYLLSCWVMCGYVFLFVEYLFPHLLVTESLFIVGNPFIPCGLGEYMTRSGLPDHCS